MDKQKGPMTFKVTIKYLKKKRAYRKKDQKILYREEKNVQQKKYCI